MKTTLTNRQTNKRWNILVINDYPHIEYHEWKQSFIETNADNPPDEFIKKLMDTPEYQLYAQYSQMRTLRSIRDWIMIGCIVLILCGLIQFIFIPISKVGL